MLKTPVVAGMDCHDGMQQAQSSQSNNKTNVCCFVFPFTKADVVAVKASVFFETGKVVTPLPHFFVFNISQQTEVHSTFKFFNHGIPRINPTLLAVKQSFLI